MSMFDKNYKLFCKQSVFTNIYSSEIINFQFMYIGTPSVYSLVLTVIPVCTET